MADDVTDMTEAQIRARLDVAEAVGAADLIEAEDKHLEAIGRKREKAAEKRSKAATSIEEPPKGRAARQQSKTADAPASSSDD